MKKIVLLFLALFMLAGCDLFETNIQKDNEDETKNLIENKILSAKELYDLNLNFKKPDDVYIKDNFEYCKGDQPNNYSCENNYKEYTTYEVDNSDYYQTANVLFSSAEIDNSKLIVKFYIYNWEQQGDIYCNGEENTNVIDGNKTQNELARELCEPYTYTFDITKDTKDNTYQYIFNNIK